MNNPTNANLAVRCVLPAGFSAAVGQILVLRELLVLFYGNELSTGLIFACWLFWTAAGSFLSGLFGRDCPPSPAFVLAGVLALSFLLPTSILWIRGARAVLSIPTGELPSLNQMIVTALSATCGFCLVSGAIFGLSWRIAAADPAAKEGGAIAVYLAESAGAAAGGVLFYFVLLPRMSNFAAAILTSLVLGCAVVFFAGLYRRQLSKARLPIVAAFLCVAVFAGAFVFSGRIEEASRRWQWGPGFIESRDTPFHNLALLERPGQFSFFSNGLWLFSVPDPQSAELSAHFPMLEREKPESVLLIGGGAGEVLSEVLKYPGLRAVHCVEPDPELPRFARERLPNFMTRAMDDPRVRFFHEDAGKFMREGATRYDVIVMSLGEPVNAEMNRFYTLEFFSKARDLLKPGGVFSFSVASSAEIVGPRNALLLQSLFRTLSDVFEDVFVVPEEGTRFFASNRKGALVRDPGMLIARLEAAKLDLRYVRAYSLSDMMNPMRLAYASAMVAQEGGTKVNRDFEPVCYLHTLVLWGSQIHPGLGSAVRFLSRVEQRFFWLAVVAAILVLLGAFRVSRAGPGKAVLLNVAIAGGVLMGLEIVLLLGFQVIEGFVYTELALIIASSMCGLGLGAAAVRGPAKRMKDAAGRLFMVQMVLALYMPAVLGALVLLKDLHARTAVAVAGFVAMALVAGLIGGAHFCLAVLAYGGAGKGKSETAGSKLYAADLLGAASGGLAASLFLLPVYGIPVALLAAGAITAGAAPLLIGEWVNG